VAKFSQSILALLNGSCGLIAFQTKVKEPLSLYNSCRLGGQKLNAVHT